MKRARTRHRHTQKEKDNRQKFCCTWRARDRDKLLQNLTIHDHQEIIMVINHRQGRNNRITKPHDQLQVRVDVLQGDVDEEIGELHSRVKKLKGVALAIETEGKF